MLKAAIGLVWIDIIEVNKSEEFWCMFCSQTERYIKCSLGSNIFVVQMYMFFSLLVVKNI